MRDIKFRAWDIVHNQMCYNANVLFWDEGGNLAGFEGLRPTGGAAVLIKGEFIAMQFTGLHDKNGKEIYEGDIVESDKNCLRNVGRHTGQVKFCDGVFMIRSIALNGLRDFNPEIIGNIHENPELLEELV